MPASCPALWLSIAAVLAPLLSIVIFSGVPFHLIAFAQEAQRGFAIPFGSQQEIHRVTGLIDSRYKYFQVPLTLT
jgi:hypothetical protein